MREEFYKNKYGIQWQYAEDRLEKSLNLIASCNPKRVLDCGCGDGFIAEKIKNLSPSKIEVFGIDISQTAGDKVRIKNIFFKKADVSKKISFPDRFFDLVFAGEIIEHLEDPDKFLLEVNRVLKKNGFLVISTPNLAAWYNRILLFLGIQPVFTETSSRFNPGKPKILGKESDPVGHLRLYTIGALKELLKFYGFKSLTIKGIGFLPRTFFYQIDRIIAKLPSLASGMVILSQKFKNTNALKETPLFIVRHFNPDIPSAIPTIASRIAEKSKYQPTILSDSCDQNIKRGNVTIVQKRFKTSLAFFRFCARYIKENDIKKVAFWGSLFGGVLISFLVPKKTKIILNIYSSKPKVKDFFNLKIRDFFIGYNRTVKLSFKEMIIPQFIIRYYLKKPNVSKIIVPSLRLKRQFENYVEHNDSNKIVWLKHGIDAQEILSRSTTRSYHDPQILKKKPMVMFFGHCYLARGIDDLIKAASLAKNLIDFQLIFLFSELKNDDSRKISKILKKHKILEDTIVLHKNLDNPFYFINLADVVVFPYRFSGEIPEYPLALLESMALKKPIITTSIGATNELIEDKKNGFLVKPKNPREIALLIRKILLGHFNLLLASENCYERVKEISWEKTAEFIDSIIEHKEK